MATTFVRGCRWWCWYGTILGVLGLVTLLRIGRDLLGPAPLLKPERVTGTVIAKETQTTRISAHQTNSNGTETRKHQTSVVKRNPESDQKDSAKDDNTENTNPIGFENSENETEKGTEKGEIIATKATLAPTPTPTTVEPSPTAPPTREATSSSTTTNNNNTQDTTTSSSSSSPPLPVAGDTFAPGSLNLSRFEAFERCYVDPLRYETHLYHKYRNYFSSPSGHTMYLQVPKSGSSSVRATMDEVLGDVSKTNCYTSSWNSNKVDKLEEEHPHRFTFVREPLERFVSGFQEAMLRWVLRRVANEIPPTVELERFFQTHEGNVTWKKPRPEDAPQVLQALEDFVAQAYDGYEFADTHLVLQVPTLAGRPDKDCPRIQEIYDVADQSRVFSQWWNVTAKTSGNKPYYSRRMHLNATDLPPSVRTKLCQILAIDYCCLNFKLPQVCEGAVECRWKAPPDTNAINTSAPLLIEPVSPYPVPFRTSLEPPPSTHDLAWLVAYPEVPTPALASSSASASANETTTSTTTTTTASEYLLNKISRASGTSTATNYPSMETVNNQTAKWLPIDRVHHPNEGPYYYHRKSHNQPPLPLPPAMVLTHTHCSPRPWGSPPQFQTTAGFLRACASSDQNNKTSPLWEPRRDFPRPLEYSPNRVKKAVYLLRDPVDTIVSAYQARQASKKRQKSSTKKQQKSSKATNQGTRRRRHRGLQTNAATNTTEDSQPTTSETTTTNTNSHGGTSETAATETITEKANDETTQPAATASTKNPGIRLACESWQSRWKQEAKQLKLDRISGIPCALEFYQWTQWHNLARRSLDLLGIPVLTIRYEDAQDASGGETTDATTERVLEFLNLPSVAQGNTAAEASSGSLPRVSATVDEASFAPEELSRIKSLVRAVADPATWEDVRHYFAGIPDPPPSRAPTPAPTGAPTAVTTVTTTSTTTTGHPTMQPTIVTTEEPPPKKYSSENPLKP